MKTMALLLRNHKPADVWKRGLKAAQRYSEQSEELVALLLIEKDDDLV